MSRKTNSTSLKLGKTTIWPIFSQNYGSSIFMKAQNFKIYYYLYLLLIFVNKNYNASITNVNINIKNKISITLYYYFDSHLELQENFNLINSYIGKLNYRFSEIYSIKFYLKLKTFSTLLITNYFQNLLNKNFSLKKIFSIVYVLLEANINSKKIIYMKFGIQKLILKGFKIRLSGRLDNNSKQMAKALEYTYGNIPLVSIENYIEYSNLIIFSKLGSCNFQIWLFYKII